MTIESVDLSATYAHAVTQIQSESYIAVITGMSFHPPVTLDVFMTTCDAVTSIRVGIINRIMSMHNIYWGGYGY